MNVKNLIVITIVLIFGFILIITFFRLYPYLLNVFYSHYLKKQEVVKEDHKFHYYPVDDPKGILIFVLDRRMDHLGNTMFLETNLGIQLAKLSIKKQYVPVFYDRIDANIPPNIFFSIRKLTDQWIGMYHVIFEWNRNNFPISIFAFGDGCNVVLSSILEIKNINVINKIFLVNCGYTDSLLNYYGRLISYSMKISKVEEDIIVQAKKEWEEWYQQKEYQVYTDEMWQNEQSELIKNQIHPDLIAFRKTIKNFQKNENLSFLKEAKQIFFYKQLKDFLKNKNIQVFHFLSEFDEEIPEEILFEIKKKSSDLKEYNFHFAVLKNTSHLLYEIEKKLDSPLEVAIFRNPFGKIFSQDFIKKFYENL